MRPHHLALLAADPGALAAFYAQVLGLPELRRQSDAAGLRSVWLDAEGMILMVERAEARTPGAQRGETGWNALIFAAAAGSAAGWAERLGPTMRGRTDYTIYAEDPEGNRFGISSFPEPLGALPGTP